MSSYTLSPVVGLSLRQPWAWLVVHGLTRKDGTRERKDLENRVWGSNYRGPFLIHAAKGMTRREHDEAIEWIADQLGMGIRDQVECFPRFEEYVRGAIVGIATVTDCIRPCFPKERWDEQLHLMVRAACPHKWHMRGQFGFVLRNVEDLPPIESRGAIGFYRVDDDIRRKVDAILRDRRDHLLDAGGHR